MELFADGTFAAESPPTLSSMCAESDPRHGASTMRAEVVRAKSGTGVTEGMREWSMMHWYEMAAFAVIRETCCAAPVPLVLPRPLGSCAPLDETLRDLATAVATGADHGPALAAYTKAVHCTVSSGAGAYKYETRPLGGEEEAVKKTIARVTAGRSKR
jgi:hypothetical protein